VEYKKGRGKTDESPNVNFVKANSNVKTTTFQTSRRHTGPPENRAHRITGISDPENRTHWISGKSDPENRTHRISGKSDPENLIRKIGHIGSPENRIRKIGHIAFPENRPTQDKALKCNFTNSRIQRTGTINKARVITALKIYLTNNVFYNIRGEQTQNLNF
jgi:hypothetical protein